MIMADYIDRNKLIAEYDRVHVGAPGGARKLMIDAPSENVIDIDETIEWCRRKIDSAKRAKVFTAKQYEGYKNALLTVMSYLHCEKERRRG